MDAGQQKYFVEYWEKNRERESKILTQLLFGIPIGLLFSLPVFLIVFTSRFWYKRADMLVNTRLSPWLLLIAVFIITVFVAIFYKRHQWDMKEQQYQEFMRNASEEVADAGAAKEGNELSSSKKSS